jgi:pyridinium-3,5-biscarboxylic acid mononucleotide synthase
VNRERLEELLLAVAAGRLEVETAIGELQHLPFADLDGFAKIDHHRELRHGAPEVVFGPGKSAAQQARIAGHLLASGQNLLITRTTPEAFAAVKEVAPQAVFHELARAITAEVRPRPEVPGRVGIVSAGTSDMPVAEEAAVTAMALGIAQDRLYDVGVAGLHRLLAQRDRIVSADVLIVVAGMEGALPSVVGGLAGQPIVAVPTSVGYGAGAGGLAALLGMLNSCAPGLVVVNIDNGFGAAFAAYRMLRMAARLRSAVT